MTDSHAFETHSLPEKGRLLGIDFGTVRVGIAVCDEGRTIASPLETYTRRSEKLDAEFFQALIRREHAVGIVVGLPLHMSGEESQKSAQARQYAAWLTAVTGLPIALVDERYSTILAQEILAAGQLTAKQRKARIDRIAAQAILAAFLESPDQTSSSRSLDD